MEGSVEALSKYRFETAKEALEDARMMFEHGRYKNVLNIHVTAPKINKTKKL